MDLEEWEFLPTNDGFIDLDEDGVRKIVHSGKRNSNQKNDLDVDYFIYPSQDQQSSPTLPKQLVQVPISWEPIVADKGMEDTNHTNKIEGIEFADMKIESPRVNSSTSPRIIDLSQIDSNSSAIDESLGAAKIEPPRENLEETDEKLNLLKLGVSGVGAICSFGVAAAATVCIILFGNSQKNNNRIRFQIYTDAKVGPHASKLNQAVSAASGVLVHKAHISFGGCYGGL